MEDIIEKKIKGIMKDCLETRGYNPTKEQIDELYEIYTDCQTWVCDVMVTGKSYEEIEDFIRHSSEIDRICN